MTAPLPDPDTIRRLVAEVIARLQAGVDDEPTVTVADRVITLAVVAGVPSGTRRVRVPAAAVVTPSAREGAAERGLEIVRGTVPAGSPAAARPFIVARADCPDGAAARVAAVHRAVPNASQLPPTGLADVVAALAAHASRDAARGVLLTSRPAMAAILANRQAGLRAVTGRDVPTLLAAASESCANLLVVDPRHLSAGGLERLCAEFARRELGDVPADLAASSRPCACNGHPH